MRTYRTACMTIAVASLLGASGLVLAQSTTTAPSQALPKAIGQTTGQAEVEQKPVPSLIVLNSRSATLDGGKLALVGVSPNSIVFADRPVRAAGHVLTANLLEEWDHADGTFAMDPPNATISVLGKDGSVRDAVIVMKAPKLEGDQLTFDVDVLEGNLNGSDGPASVFIDRFAFGGFRGGGFAGGGFGRGGGFAAGGFGRGGFAVGGAGRGVAVGGVGRNVGVVGVDHGAWYRGANLGAVAGAAAVGGALGAGYWGGGYYGGALCGYYPYPPCY